ncbi:MAG: c-type cytochrome [Comamonadaceae bacterium]|nr:cytochrome c4 [Burkholderiales bacterium]MEB2348696.1 c-type cytochrome [Comamonadaceae bacterium]
MNKAWTTVSALVVAFATGSVLADGVKGDAAAGAQKNAMCIGCHNIIGYQSSFPEVYKVPMISGQNAAYIDAALQEYKKGERKFPTMRGIAASLTEQDMADLGAFYQADGKAIQVPEKPTKAPSDDVAQLLQKGACVSCHGENFSKPINDAYPKLAGQHPDYLYVSLKAYKNPKEGPYSGRANGVMGGVAAQFSNNELKALADYIGSLDSQLQVVPEPRFR